MTVVQEDKAAGRRLHQVIEPLKKQFSQQDERVRRYLWPQRILWQSQEGQVEQARCLLSNRQGQVGLGTATCCLMKNHGKPAAILLDFGLEIQGGVQIFLTSFSKGIREVSLRVRFGESAMEAMSDVAGSTATNDHAVRDQVIQASTLGMTEVGNTGFRFARIDLMTEMELEINEIRAFLVYYDLEYQGSFHCSDPLLDQIWLTGAYTVHLNMQNYIWDGIKRDRLVWVGDMHPETLTIQTVFGKTDLIHRSLDFVRDTTPLPGWMNLIPSYSMWWIIIQHDLYLWSGDLSYLKSQKTYLTRLLLQLRGCVRGSGRSDTPDTRFLDWPSSKDQAALDAGLQALHILTLEAGASLMTVLEDEETARLCREGAVLLRAYPVKQPARKQAAALMVLAGIADAAETNQALLAVGQAKGLSSFYGFYVLKARAMAGDITGSLQAIRDYWGGMLSLGATTFWEDFNLDWLDHAARIDELPGAGQIDVHAAYGDYCYRGYRHSLCHGWASGPTSWLMEAVLGIRIQAPGCRSILLRPDLGDLEWAEGTFPTPAGPLHVRCERQSDGRIKTEYQAPDGIDIRVQDGDVR
ncbi:MAG: alpha-L-rhamnosidase C-terminal domain-containing protein [Clostridiaceae bacterium]|nr:alpha-L-rhamnosidase C-terminal domain-containing protein [Clostridiaceae bacterium]